MYNSCIMILRIGVNGFSHQYNSRYTIGAKIISFGCFCYPKYNIVRIKLYNNIIQTKKYLAGTICQIVRWKIPSKDYFSQCFLDAGITQFPTRTILGTPWLFVNFVWVEDLALGNMNVVCFWDIFPIIACFISRMTCGNLLFYGENEWIPFAIEKYPFYQLNVAWSFTFNHQPVLRTAKHVYLACFNGLFNSVFIHITESKHFSIQRIDNDRRDESFFIEV